MKKKKLLKSKGIKKHSFLIITSILIISIFIISGTYIYGKYRSKLFYDKPLNEQGPALLADKVLTDFKWDYSLTDNSKSYYKIPLDKRDWSALFDCPQELKTSSLNISLKLAEQFNSNRTTEKTIFSNSKDIREKGGDTDPLLVMYEAKCYSEYNEINSNIILVTKIHDGNKSWFEVYDFSIISEDNFETHSTRNTYLSYDFDEMDFYYNPLTSSIMQLAKLTNDIYIGAEEVSNFMRDLSNIGGETVYVFQKNTNGYRKFKGILNSTIPLDKNFTKLKITNNGILVSADDLSTMGQYRKLFFINTKEERVKLISSYKDLNSNIDAQPEISNFGFNITNAYNNCKSDKTMNKYGTYKVFTFKFENEGKEILIEACYNKFNNYIYIQRGNDNAYRYIPTRTQIKNYSKGITFNQNIFENPKDGKLIINIFGKDYPIVFK